MLFWRGGNQAVANACEALELEQTTPSVLPEAVQFTARLEAARKSSLAAVEEAIDWLQDLTVLVSSLSASTKSCSDDIEKADAELEPSSGTPTALVIRGRLKSRFPGLDPTISKRLEETIMKRQDWLLSTAQATAELKSLASSQESRDREISETASLKSVSCPDVDHYALPEAPEAENDHGTWSYQWCHDQIPIAKQDNSRWR